jgi:hypothetical protein
MQKSGSRLSSQAQPERPSRPLDRSTRRWVLPILRLAALLVCVVAAAGQAVAASAPGEAGAAPSSTPAMAPAAVAEILARAPDRSAYPGTDAVTLFEEVTYRVDAEGRLTHRVHRLRRLLTEWACRNLSDLRVDWDSARQELQVRICRTHLPDGTFIDTPARGINEVTPDAVARCADLLTLREMVISHVGVKPGAIIETEYEVSDRQPGPFPAGGIEFLQEENPLLQKRIVIESQRPIRAQLVGADSLLVRPPVSTNATTGTTDGSGAPAAAPLVWEVRDVPAQKLAARAQARGDVHPYLAFAAGDWPATIAGLRACLPDQTTAPSLAAWLRGDQSAPEADLTALDTAERIAALLGDRILTVAPVDPWGLTPRSPETVFAAGCGTDLEKCLLAMKLLRLAGLEPELGLFSRWHRFPQEAPVLQAYGPLRVVVRVGDENLWLDADSGRPRPGRSLLAGHVGLFLEDSPQGYRTYVVPAVPAGCELSFELRPAETRGFFARLDLILGGALREKAADRPAAEVATGLARQILCDAEPTEVTVRSQDASRLHVRASFQGEKLAGQQDRLYLLPLPAPERDVLGMLPPLPDLRDGAAPPLTLVEDLREEIHLRLVLPDSLAAACLPPTTQVQRGEAFYSLARAQEGDRIVIDRVLALPAAAYAVGPETDLVAVLEAAARPDARTFLLRAE